MAIHIFHQETFGKQKSKKKNLLMSLPIGKPSANLNRGGGASMK